MTRTSPNRTDLSSHFVDPLFSTPHIAYYRTIVIVIDFVIVSEGLENICKEIQPVYTPWEPHIGLEWAVMARPRAIHVRQLVSPRPLPIEDFLLAWKVMSHSVQNALARAAAHAAHRMLISQFDKTGIAILGRPDPRLCGDEKFSSNLSNHVLVGESLAHAALTAELLV